MQLFGEFIIIRVSCYRRPYRCLWIGSIFMTLFGTMTVRDYRNVRILDRLLFLPYQIPTTSVKQIIRRKCSWQKATICLLKCVFTEGLFLLTENLQNISVKWHVMKTISTCPEGENYKKLIKAPICCKSHLIIQFACSSGIDSSSDSYFQVIWWFLQKNVAFHIDTYQLYQ